jgi:uncharacterized protein (DUF1778 family)
MPSAAPTARLEARISTELHAMLKRAAEIQGRSLTDLVVSAVQVAAQRAIEQGEMIRLFLADSERFARAGRTRRQPWSAPSRVAASCYDLPRRHKSKDLTLVSDPRAAQVTRPCQAATNDVPLSPRLPRSCPMRLNDYDFRRSPRGGPEGG